MRGGGTPSGHRVMQRHGKSTVSRASSRWQSFRMGNGERRGSVEVSLTRGEDPGDFARELCEKFTCEALMFKF